MLLVSRVCFFFSMSSTVRHTLLFCTLRQKGAFYTPVGGYGTTFLWCSILAHTKVRLTHGWVPYLSLQTRRLSAECPGECFLYLQVAIAVSGLLDVAELYE